MVESIARMISSNSFDCSSIINAIASRYPDLDERKSVINTYRPGTNGCNLLTCALACQQRNRTTVVKFLLQSGADPNWRTHSGTHVLVFRSYSAKTDVDNLMALLAYGADPNAVSHTYSILYKNIISLHRHTAHVLLTHGASITEEEHVLLRTRQRCMEIITDFYDHISLRKIALHHIRLRQIVKNYD